MSSKIKFIVALGALMGVVGVFIPLATASVGFGSGALTMGMSLWAAKSVPGISILSYGFLGLFAVAAVFSIAGITTRFGRGLAAGTLLAAIAPAGIAIYWLSQTLTAGGTGAGLVLLAAGGLVASVGSVIALVRPEPVARAEEVPAAA